MTEIRNIQDFSDFVDNLLSHSESDDLEYKSAAGGFPGSFWDTYSAFANSDGGIIMLGVSEKKDGLYLDNLSDAQIEKYRIDFWNNVNNPSTVNCNLMKTEDLKIVDYKGHKLMLFYIPRANREQRPVYRSTQPYNGTFKRNHEGDYKCTEREVQRMFSDANVSCPADCRILHNYSMDDIDQTSLKQYRQLFSLSKPDHPWLALDDLSLLKKLGGYRIDRQTGEEGFTLPAFLCSEKENPSQMSNVVRISFLTFKKNLILTYDGQTGLCLTGLGKRTFSSFTGLSYHACKLYYLNHSYWKTISAVTKHRRT